MNDLPQQGTTVSSPQSQPMFPSGTLGSTKEGEGMPVSELPMQEIGREIELPKEVASAGVKVQPTIVTIPQPVSTMGVKPAGSSVPVGTGSTITLPLTQAQITEGLEKNIQDSWRWLAVWCIRRLKQLRFLNPNKLSTNNE